MLRDAGLATPDWSVPPDWTGWTDGAGSSRRRWKTVRSGWTMAAWWQAPRCEGPRARPAPPRFGGDWFAEEYVEGREFNIALLGSARDLRILPMAEMTL